LEAYGEHSIDIGTDFKSGSEITLERLKLRHRILCYQIYIVDGHLCLECCLLIHHSSVSPTYFGAIFQSSRLAHGINFFKKVIYALQIFVLPLCMCV
jgi:hypothetical protein